MVNHQLRVEDLGIKETNKQKNIRRSKHNSSPVECREWRCWWGKPNAITHSPTMTGCHFISAQIRVYLCISMYIYVYLCIPMYTYVYLRMYNIWSWGWFFSHWRIFTSLTVTPLTKPGKGRWSPSDLYEHPVDFPTRRWQSSTKILLRLGGMTQEIAVLLFKYPSLLGK